MRKRTEYERWARGEYPYDMAECGWCATQHALLWGCCQQNHAEMREEAKKLRAILQTPVKFRKAILAFREKFARFYGTAGDK
jgi:hypothetical protein